MFSIQGNYDNVANNTKTVNISFTKIPRVKLVPFELRS
jgi:hypothetical protein